MNHTIKLLTFSVKFIALIWLDLIFLVIKRHRQCDRKKASCVVVVCQTKCLPLLQSAKTQLIFHSTFIEFDFCHLEEKSTTTIRSTLWTQQHEIVISLLLIRLVQPEIFDWIRHQRHWCSELWFDSWLKDFLLRRSFCTQKHEKYFLSFSGWHRN